MPDQYLPPSGRQFEIRHGDQHAVVTEVGATLRHYAVGGKPVIDGFDVDDMASGGRGQVLAPWPNRLGNGRYTFEGQAERVPLNEPERANAIHGLVRWLQWTPVAQSDRHGAAALRARTAAGLPVAAGAGDRVLAERRPGSASRRRRPT